MYTIEFGVGTTIPGDACLVTGIPTTEDGDIEGDHSFSVSLLEFPAESVLSRGSPDEIEVTIMDNDGEERSR